MKFHLYKISGYEEAIMSLRMSKGKYYSWDKARDIQQLVYVLTDDRGFYNTEEQYKLKLQTIDISNNKKITGKYEKDKAEFERLLGLTMNNAMVEFDHHTLMKYIDITFITEDLHRGAQDDLDSHAIGFNNRITRFSTRLAEISEQKLSEWYQDKVIPFHEAYKLMKQQGLLTDMLTELKVNGQIFKYTPFGYVHEKYAQVPAKNGLAKDVQRGLMALGTPGCALWKSDLFNLRYIYFRRSKLTKANPELKLGMEMLADQIEEHLPVFGKYFRKEFTDSGTWEHVNKVKTISSEEFEEFKKYKESTKQN